MISLPKTPVIEKYVKRLNKALTAIWNDQRGHKIKEKLGTKTYAFCTCDIYFAIVFDEMKQNADPVHSHIEITNH